MRLHFLKQGILSSSGGERPVINAYLYLFMHCEYLCLHLTKLLPYLIKHVFETSLSESRALHILDSPQLSCQPLTQLQAQWLLFVLGCKIESCSGFVYKIDINEFIYEVKHLPNFSTVAASSRRSICVPTNRKGVFWQWC